MPTLKVELFPTFAISYIRFSSRKQKRNSSYSRQLEDTQTYCKENGLTLIENLEDLGISAWDKSNLDDKAALGGFLQRVEAGRIPKGTVLVCENLDRLTRASILDALQLFIRILQNGIDIVTTMDGKRYSEKTVNAMELVISITYLQRGHEESQTKSKRVSNSVKIRREKIGKGEFAKFHCPSWLTHDGKQYHLIEENAQIVKQIFELYVAGNGVYSLRKELTERGVKSFTKTKKWSTVFLYELLENPAVIGTFALVDPPRKGYYPAAINETLYYRALDKRKSNCNHRGKRGTKEINIYGGLVKCHCGASMVRSYSKNAYKIKYEGLVCSRTKLGECPYQYTNWKRFNESFRAVLISPPFERFINDLNNVPVNDRTGELNGKITEANTNLGRVAGVLARVQSSALETQLANLEAERKALEAELQAETIRVRTVTNKTVEWEKYVKRLDRDFNNKEFRLLLRDFMRKTIEKIECFQTYYCVTFKGRPEKITVNMVKDKEKDGFEVRADGFLCYKVFELA